MMMMMMMMMMINKKNLVGLEKCYTFASKINK